MCQLTGCLELRSRKMSVPKRKSLIKKIAISPNTYKKYFTEKSNDEIQQIVEQALEMFYSDRKEHT